MISSRFLNADVLTADVDFLHEIIFEQEQRIERLEQSLLVLSKATTKLMDSMDMFIVQNIEVDDVKY